MPLPLGHATIGLAVHSVLRSSDSGRTSWKTLALVVFLANLPDTDMLVGLIFEGNGNAFHRGPTHSLLFACIMGLLASHAWRFWSVVPRVSFLWAFLLVLSHVVADAVFTTSPVSFLWPLQVNWSVGHSGWTDVIASVALGSYRDAGIVLGFGLLIVINELFRRRVQPFTAVLSRIRYIAGFFPLGKSVKP